MGVAGQVTVGQGRGVTHRLAGRDEKAVSEVIEAHPESVILPAHRLDRGAIRLEPKVGTAQLHGPIEARPGHGRPAPPAPGVDPVVRSPNRIVDRALHLAPFETGEDPFSHFRLVVPVPVGKEEDVRLRHHDHPSPGRQHAVGRRDIVRPHHDFVHAPVTVPVTQQLERTGLPFPRLRLHPGAHPDPPNRGVQLAGLVQLGDVEMAFQVVTVNLGHEEPAVLVPRHAAWIPDERLARDEVDAKPLRQVEVLHALFRTERPGGVVGLGDLGPQRESRHDRCQRQDFPPPFHGGERSLGPGARSIPKRNEHGSRQITLASGPNHVSLSP